MLAFTSVTENFFTFMFANTNTTQMEMCNDVVKGVYSTAGMLAAVFTGFAGVAFCCVCACCFGSCEAWAARNDFEYPSKKYVGDALRVVEEEKPLMTKESPKPIGSAGAPPEGGAPGCCSALARCGRR